MADPSRDIRRVLNTAMIISITGFVLMNTALYSVLPFETVRERSTVAVVRHSHPCTIPEALRDDADGCVRTLVCNLLAMLAV
jgi:hypothetical protein